jgi:hypothetical protein
MSPQPHARAPQVRGADRPVTIVVPPGRPDLSPRAARALVRLLIGVDSRRRAGESISDAA